ncbi:MAG: hypothetical protein ACRD8A_03800 [Candidatus Acidiferrales bacterium]
MNRSQKRGWIGTIPASIVAVMLCVPAILFPVAAHQQPQSRVIDIVADHDSRFKIQGQDQPILTLTAGETVHLRITAVKAKNRNRDGSVHGFELLRADRTPVPAWDLLLKPGLQEFDLTAPDQPGEYLVVCTVICSSGHERMTMKVIIEPKAK